MALVPFLTNPPRKMLAYGLNPKRKRHHRRKKKNPLERVHFPPHDSTLFRRKESGKWGHKKRRANPAKKGVAHMAKKAKRHKKVRRVHRKARAKNPMVVFHRRRHVARRRFANPFALGKITSRIGLPPMKEIAFLGLGAVSANLGVSRALTALPPIFSTHPLARAASRLALVAAAGFVAQKALGKNERSKAFLYGALANQVPLALNDVLSLTGVKLSDGEEELSLYTLSGGSYAPQIGEGTSNPTVGLYTMNEGDTAPVIG